jgi:hypothetical protein
MGAVVVVLGDILGSVTKKEKKLKSLGTVGRAAPAAPAPAVEKGEYLASGGGLPSLGGHSPPPPAMMCALDAKSRAWLAPARGVPLDAYVWMLPCGRYATLSPAPRLFSSTWARMCNATVSCVPMKPHSQHWTRALLLPPRAASVACVERCSVRRSSVAEWNGQCAHENIKPAAPSSEYGISLIVPSSASWPWPSISSRYLGQNSAAASC